MYSPDRTILKKVKAYDKELFFRWNGKDAFFELWRKMPWGDRLITPITKSIYSDETSREAAPLDERILYWLIEADSWRSGGAKKHALHFDSRFQEWERNTQKRLSGKARDAAKDLRRAAMNFYLRKVPSSGRKVRVPTEPMPKRLLQSRTAPHMFHGSNK